MPEPNEYQQHLTDLAKASALANLKAAAEENERKAEALAKFAEEAQQQIRMVAREYIQSTDPENK